MSTSKKAAQFSQGVWFALMIVATLGCVANYIYQVNSTATRGFQLRTLEKQVDQLSEVVTNLEDQTVKLHAMQSVEQRVKLLGYVPVTKMEFLGKNQGEKIYAAR